ncbi:hypothetical protein J437_LFUL010264 [Ladona fulva]|uniref:RRP15-like protein n=1 Tax=Ladona fulva TaxID=123851 RepID=A0A8K0KD67_LADFU|nr:hypothetical protein J437_LFUL010264 [Ladona fulva]
MNNFKGSILSETITDYVAPKESNVDSSGDSDSSEAEIGSPDDSEEDNDDLELEDEEDIDDDDEGGDNSDEDENMEENHSSLAKGNAGWADAMSKILKTNKPKKKKTIVLSRARTIQAVKESTKKKDDIGFEIEGEIKEEKPTEKELEVVKPKKDKSLPTVKRKEWESRGRIKPTIKDHDREKILSKIAIKGVVQLFNAVQKHQTEIESKLKEVGASELKKERVLKSIDKRSFLDVLMGNAKSVPVQDPAKTKGKIQLKAEEPKSSAWSVLREDFLTDTTLKDWDKEPEMKEDEEEQESLSSDDEDAEMT